MTIKSRILMSDSGDSWNVQGSAVECNGYYGTDESFCSVSVSVMNFVGTLYLYGTLENSPELADANNGWVPIKNSINSKPNASLKFTSDGAGTAYNIGTNEYTDVIVSISGVIQTPVQDYTIIDSVLTFNEVIPQGELIVIRILNLSSDTDRTPFYENFVSDGVSSEYALVGTVLDSDVVYVVLDGVIQTRGSDFTVLDNKIQFDEIPSVDVEIFVSDYPQVPNSSENYFMRFPVDGGSVDMGPVNPSPIYGPRTTGTFIGSFDAKYTYVRARLDRDYIKDSNVVPQDSEAVGAVSSILISF